VIQRLPTLLGDLLRGFHWRGHIDAINYIGAALMILLMPMLVAAGHPGVMVWANKSGVGKSLLAQLLVILKDGITAGATTLDGGPREIENQIASELNDGRSTLFIDNQRGAINSTVLEANMTVSLIRIRGFHTQHKIERPNDVLWLLTSNDAVPTDDLLQRCIHIHLHFEGQVERREFAIKEDELKQFVTENREALISLLAGMVERWKDVGRPMVKTPCRFEKCGNLIGSILHANGLPGFLSNARAEVQARSEGLQQLTAVAERILDERKTGLLLEVGEWSEAAGLFAEARDCRMEQVDWIPYLEAVKAIPLTCDTVQKRKTVASQFLSAIAKVPVEVAMGDTVVECMVLSKSLGQRRMGYVLAVRGMPPQGSLEAGEQSSGDINSTIAGLPTDQRGGATSPSSTPAPAETTSLPDSDTGLWG
jgi:hypothetical protein